MDSPAPANLWNHEAEEKLLGLLMTTSCVDGVAAARLLIEREQLTGADFNLPCNGALFNACVAMLGSSAPADPVSVYQRIQAHPAVAATAGLQWVLRLFEGGEGLITVVPEAYANFARLIRELALRRRLVSEAREIQAMAGMLSLDAGAVLQQAGARIAAITFRRDTFRTLTEIVADVEKELERTNDGGGTKLIPSGIQKLDRLIGGLPPLLIVVGGRPGAGKSAVAATLTQAMAQGGHKLGIFSLEDRAPWLAYRLLSGNSGVSNQALRFRKLSGDEWERAGRGFATVRSYSDKVLIDDRRRMTGSDIAQSARNMIVNHGVQALLIDHLLEVKPQEKFARKDLEVAAALGAFRDIANEYEVPVVVFTQLNRGAEAKGEPAMTDFKDAGAVEEMARVAIALVRKDDTIGFCVIKNTNGQPGRVDVTFNGAAAMVAAVERQGSLYDE